MNFKVDFNKEQPKSRLANSQHLTRPPQTQEIILLHQKSSDNSAWNVNGYPLYITHFNVFLDDVKCDIQDRTNSYGQTMKRYETIFFSI